MAKTSFHSQSTATRQQEDSTLILFGDERTSWLKENKVRLLAGVGILTGVVIVALSVVLFNRSQNATGREALRVGIAALQAGKNQEAILALEKAKTRFRSGREAQLARFYLSEAYRQSGKTDAANLTLAESTPPTGGASYLSQSLLLVQGREAEKRQDRQAAQKAYESASLLEGPFTADAVLGVARVSEATGDTSAALAAREKFLNVYPTSPLAEVVRKKLGQ